MYYASIAQIAYIVFAIWPSLITPVYGWATDSLHLTKYINPVVWTDQDRQSEKHYLTALKATDNLWEVINKIRQPSMTQPDISSEDIISYLADAIEESALVTDDFLRKTHPDFPSRYTQLRDSLRNIDKFFSGGDDQKMMQAAQQYEQYCDWLDANYKRFRVIE